MGRGSVNDPSAFLEQYFETGVTPRLSYSNPKLDALLQAERREFDPDKRKGELLQAFDLIQQETPAVFLWRIDSLYGVSDKIAFTPHPDDRLFGTDITVK